MTVVHDALARREAPKTVTEMVNALTGELRRAAPKGMDGDRLARLALTVIRKDQTGKGQYKLADADPASFAGALLTAAALGLEVGTGEAHLVAYKREVTFIPDFKGLAKLFYQHPLAKHLGAEVVYENDHFDYGRGLDPYLVHKPLLGGDRGKVIAYYAVASLNTGAKDFVVMTPEEVKAVRQGKVGPSGNIVDPMRWMERKTVLKQLLKLMPKSSSLQQALDADERTGTDLRAEMVAPAALPAGALNEQTGEVFEGTVEEPDVPAWSEPVAQPGSKA